MPFKIRKLNHSPDWYRGRFNSEEGSAPLRAQLKKDCEFLGADWDLEMTYAERIEIYAEVWDKTLSGKGGNADPSDLQEVIIREMGKGFLKKEEFSGRPFKEIERIMEENEITPDQLREFLKWNAKRENVKKAREKKGRGKKRIALAEFNKMSLMERIKYKEAGGLVEEPEW
jgi:hypothetical protein